jgi:transcriptional regulator with XRE-family HTH domain
MTGEELKTLRIKLGYSQALLAEKLYITAGAVSRIESNENKMSRQTKVFAEQLKSRLDHAL